MSARQPIDEDEYRRGLATVMLDGPFDFPGATAGAFAMAAFFGDAAVPRGRFAICLRCGAVIVLNDPEEQPDGPPVERGVRIHAQWHAETA